MEERKLNFEKPLLSARHITSGASHQNGTKWKIQDSVRSVRRPPKYKSELKSGPVSNPGTVPFQWEQIPGRPKDDETRLELHIYESYQVPKLPPGRTLRVGGQEIDKASANPVQHKDQPRSVPCDSSNVQPLDENVNKQSGSFRDVKEEVENSSSENEDEEFVDALETLSRAESLLINCSLSGVSGLQDAGMKECGISPVDSQTRDFMMGRFLPAAKAMASEAPQHAPRKQPIVRQQSRPQIKKVNEDKHHQLRYGPDFALKYLQHNGNEDEDSDPDYDEGANFRGKICGFLPGLGFRNPLCLLNPIPGLSMRSHTPTDLIKSQAGWPCNQTNRKISTVGLETSKQQANNTKDLEKNSIPIHHISLDKEGFPSFRQSMVDDNQSKKKNVGSLVAEKTLYVDTEDEVRSLHSRSRSSDSNVQTEFELKKHENLDEERDQIQILDSSRTNTEALDLMNEGVQSEIRFQIHDFQIVSSRSEANQKTRTGMQTPPGQEQDIFKGSKMLPKERRKSESKIYSELLVPPPLPKSPSDSWLGRTLTSISTKNTSVHSFRRTWIDPKDQESNTKSSDPKWETLVRMSKMQDKHLGFSEDLLTPIPEA